MPLILRFITKLVRFQKLPGDLIDLGCAVVIPMRVAFYLRKLRIKAARFESVASSPNYFQWEEAVVRSDKNGDRYLAFRPFNVRAIVFA